MQTERRNARFSLPMDSVRESVINGSCSIAKIIFESSQGSAVTTRQLPNRSG